jgi:hypothetical protein
LSTKGDAQEWAGIVSSYAEERGLRYEPIGGINPKGGPVALCPGGTNRLTGELVDGFFGSSCDADEQEAGGFLSKAVLPGALLVKAHMPDLAKVVPVFDVESITRMPAEVDFGITEQQLFFHWRLRERTEGELKEALRSAGGIFDRLHGEMEENNLDIYKAGPWNAGLEPFPPKIGS